MGVRGVKGERLVRPGVSSIRARGTKSCAFSGCLFFFVFFLVLILVCFALGVFGRAGSAKEERAGHDKTGAQLRMRVHLREIIPTTGPMPVYGAGGRAVSENNATVSKSRARLSECSKSRMAAGPLALQALDWPAAAGHCGGGNRALFRSSMHRRPGSRIRPGKCLAKAAALFAALLS